MKSQTALCVLVACVSSASICAAQTQTLSQPAQVEPYERAEIYAKASGFVAVVHIDIGDQVEQGQLLAELSVPEMEQEQLKKVALVEQTDAAIQQAEARVTSAQAMIVAAEAELAATQAKLAKHEADINFARSELTRISELVRSRSINAAMEDEKQQQLRAAEAGLVAAQAEVRSAQANVQVAQANHRQTEADLVYAHSQRKVAAAELAHVEAIMQYTQIRAPFAGQISRRTIDTGDFVTSATAGKNESLFTLNRIDRFRIVFDIPESSATQIAIGQPVQFKVDSLKGQTFSGVVKRTAGALDPKTRSLRVEAEVEDAVQFLRPGMFGMVTTTLK